MSPEFRLLIVVIVLLIAILGFLVLRSVQSVRSIRSNASEHAIPTSTPTEPYTIPLNIFQTWHTKKLPTKMQACVDSIRACNPEFKHYLYDDDDCRQFIQTHYDNDVLYAYDTLVPGAFKADLWRYCVLYKYGGIYLDIKYQCIDGFQLIHLADDEYFVQDRHNVHTKETAVYNAFMVCRAGNPILAKCIDQVVHNVRKLYYGTSPLDVTGPTMMIQFFTPNERRRLKRLVHEDEDGQYYIVYQDPVSVVPPNTKILHIYPEYRTEQRQFQKRKYYSDLWAERAIYAA